MAAPYTRDKAEQAVFEAISQMRKNAIPRIIPRALMPLDSRGRRLFFYNWDCATIEAIASILFDHNDTRLDRDFQSAFEAEFRRRRSDDNDLDQHIPHIIAQDIIYVHEGWDRERLTQQSTSTPVNGITTSSPLALQDDSSSGNTLTTRSGAPGNSIQASASSGTVDDLTNAQGDTHMSGEDDALDVVDDQVFESPPTSPPESGNGPSLVGHGLPDVALDPLYNHVSEVGTVNSTINLSPAASGAESRVANTSDDDALRESHYNEHRHDFARALQQVAGRACDGSSAAMDVNAYVAVNSAPVSLAHVTQPSGSIPPEQEGTWSESMHIQLEGAQAAEAMDCGSSNQDTGGYASSAGTDEAQHQDSAVVTDKAAKTAFGMLGGGLVHENGTTIEPAAVGGTVTEPTTEAANPDNHGPPAQGTQMDNCASPSASNHLRPGTHYHNGAVDTFNDHDSQIDVVDVSGFPKMQSAPDPSSLMGTSIPEDVSSPQDDEAVLHISQAQLDHHNKISLLEYLEEMTGAGLEQVLPIKLWPHDIRDRTALDSFDIDTAQMATVLVIECHGKLSPAEMRGAVTKAAKLRQQDQRNESRHIARGVEADVKNALWLCQEFIDRRARQRLVMTEVKDQPQSDPDRDRTNTTPPTGRLTDEGEGHGSQGSIDAGYDAECTPEGSTKMQTSKRRRGRGPFGHYGYKVKLKRITLASARNHDLKVKMRLKRLWARRSITKCSGVVQGGDDSFMNVNADAEVQKLEDKEAQPDKRLNNATSTSQSSVQSNDGTSSRPPSPLLCAESMAPSREQQHRLDDLLRDLRAATSVLGRSATRHNRGQGIYRHDAAVAGVRISYSTEGVALLHSVTFVYVPNRGGLPMARLSTSSAAPVRAQQTRICLDRDFKEFKFCLAAYCDAQAQFQVPVVLLEKIVFGVRHDETRQEYLQGWWESWGDQHAMNDTSHWRSIARLTNVEPIASLLTSGPPAPQSIDWQVIGCRDSVPSGIAFGPLGKLDNTSFRNEKLDDVCFHLLQTLKQLKISLNDDLKVYYNRDANRPRPVKIVYKSTATMYGRHQHLGFKVEDWQSRWGKMSDSYDQLEAELDNSFEHLLVPLDEAFAAHANRARELGHDGGGYAVVVLGYESGPTRKFAIERMRVMNS